MSEELKICAKISFSKSDIFVGVGDSDNLVDVSGSDTIHSTQNIATSAENLNIGDITTPGYIWVKNLDTTNYVELGYDSGGFKPFVKLKAGEEAVFRLAQTTPQAQANTSSVNIEYAIIED